MRVFHLIFFPFLAEEGEGERGKVNPLLLDASSQWRRRRRRLEVEVRPVGL